MRFLYFYLMRDAPDRVRAVAPEHAAYWRELGLPDYLGGPFVDRSGGLSPSRSPPPMRLSDSWPMTRSIRRIFWSADG
jgi:hypothetical protein